MPAAASKRHIDKRRDFMAVSFLMVLRV